jgi:hypothetical protein
MNRKQYLLMLILALIGGVIGGALSSKVFIDTQVFAQDKNKKRVIEAEEFRVVDREGIICARLMSETEEGSETTAILELLKESHVSDGIRLVASSKKCEISLRSLNNTFYISTEKYGSSMCLFSEMDEYQNNIFLFTGGGKNGNARLSLDRFYLPYLGKGAIFGKGLDIPQTIEIDVNSDCTPSLALHDKYNKTRCVLGQTELIDKTGSRIIRPPSSLVLFDKNGHVKWSAP